MKTRRGFLSILAAAIAAPFLPKLPPIKIKSIPDPLPYWPKPPFDYKGNMARATRQLQKLAAEMAVEAAKDFDFLYGDTWDGEHAYDFSNLRAPFRLRGTITDHDWPLGLS